MSNWSADGDDADADVDDNDAEANTSTGSSGVPAIVVPNLDDDEDGPDVAAEAELPNTPGSTWSFTGEEEAEDLPPTTSPVAPVFHEHSQGEGARSTHEALREAMEGVSIHDQPAETATNTAAEHIAAQRRPSGSSTSPLAVPTRLPAQDSIVGNAISPPDPALLAATSEAEPLGPGVSADTQMRADGKLQKEGPNGELITVPADEVALGAEEGRRNSMKHERSIDLPKQKVEEDALE